MNWCLPSRSEGAYLGYSDIYNTPPVNLETLRAELRQFDPRYLAAILSRLAAVLADEYRSHNIGVELAILGHFLEPTLFKRVRFWLVTGARAKVIHRLFVLEALRLLLSEASESDGTGGVPSHPHQLGELFLKMNDVCEPRYLEVSLRSENEAQRRGTALATTWRYGFFYHSENLGSAIGRSWAIHKYGLNEVEKRSSGSFPFMIEFEKVYGFSVLEVLALGFAIASRYMHEPDVLMHQADTFAVSPAYYRSLGSARMRELVPRMLRYLGRTWEEHGELMRHQVKRDPGNFLQVFSLYDYPMMSLDGSSYFPVDKDFLCAATTDGPFWKLAERVNRKRDFPRLRDTFGHAFEWYVSRLLQEYSIREGKRIVWTDWEGTLPKSHSQRSVDAIVRDGDTLFFIEATSSAVPPQATISCEWERIEEKLVEIWFSADRRAGRDKLKQIAGAMSAFETGALTLGGLTRAEVRHLVPVLLTSRATPQHFRLWERYRELCVEHGLTPEFAEKLVILDIDDVESLLAAFGGVRGWEDAFQQMALQKVGSGSMNDYIVANGLDKKRPDLLQGWVQEATDHFHHLLFPKG